jgi:hypothetical protein
MKGFLHRLATEAVRPQARLHPLTEPMYAPRMHDGAAAMPAQLEVSESVSAPRPIAGRHTGDAMRGADAAVREFAAHESLGPKPAMSGFEPLVHGKSITAGEERMSGGEAAIVPSVTSVSRTRDAEPPAVGEVSRLTAEYLPLIIERLTQGPSVDIGTAVGATQSSHGNTAQIGRVARGVVQAPVRDKAAQVTPLDEIQIHIGRIEVIAAPPPAPRAAPAPARKSMSLDDYLSRRDGRVG